MGVLNGLHIRKTPTQTSQICLLTRFFGVRPINPRLKPKNTRKRKRNEKTNGLHIRGNYNIHTKGEKTMDENLLGRITHTITHFGDDPLFDYGILGGVVGMAAGMIYCVVSGKVSDDTITMDREDYSWRE